MSEICLQVKVGAALFLFSDQQPRWFIEATHWRTATNQKEQQFITQQYPQDTETPPNITKDTECLPRSDSNDIKINDVKELIY